ncbi:MULTISPECIES: FadR/GntR family transcriptional regulator [Halocynthiibacter]|uniref:FCD domain-containing protein n=1 Tax=Halocynthiibacter halioticoli TaxID=2986804 RepID=A0AAE3LUF2_9RHOB|nr:MULTISPECIES: FCD domain-containing protein [Halocynthiibacter]MCV6823965.1 FCD domain-containing protein [Halocynthiibacter halioticoli]MCW4056966.1 FCD domain-containing protein [Halocynthiibacter sp. SDUM655004]
MGNENRQKTIDWLGNALVTVVSPGARDARASNHTDFVVDALGKAIIAGEYPAKTMIPLDPDLCEMFNVSRTVIREAKKTLIAKGLIQSKAKVGTHVRPPSEWNMFDHDVLRWHTALKNPVQFHDELFEIRLFFEPAAAAKAARSANNIDCDKLFELCDALANAETRAEFAIADCEFHKRVLGLSGNRFLQSLGDIVQTALYSLFMIEKDETFLSLREEIAQNHRRVAEAISTGAAQEAKEIMEHVITQGQLRLQAPRK